MRDRDCTVKELEILENLGYVFSSNPCRVRPSYIEYMEVLKNENMEGYTVDGIKWLD